MMKFEYQQALKNSLNYFYAVNTKEALVNAFITLINFSAEVIGELPKVKIQELYENSYDLDINDLRLAYKELETFPSVKAVENMMLVMLMLFKSFGLTFEDFQLELVKILENPS